MYWFRFWDMNTEPKIPTTQPRKAVTTMPDKKLTDSEIVKALECCANYKHTKCKGCPLGENCMNVSICSLALDLINRLQAENEKLRNQTTTYITSISELTNEVERLRADRESAMQLAADIISADKTLKAEAYKEYADKLAQNLGFAFLRKHESVLVIMESLLKELVGE